MFSSQNMKLWSQKKEWILSSRITFHFKFILFAFRGDSEQRLWNASKLLQYPPVETPWFIWKSNHKWRWIDVWWSLLLSVSFLPLEATRRKFFNWTNFFLRWKRILNPVDMESHLQQISFQDFLRLEAPQRVKWEMIFLPLYWSNAFDLQIQTWQ